MTRFIVFRVSSDQWRAMPTSTIQPSPQKIIPLSAHPTHPTQSQLPHSHLKTPQLQTIHQPPTNRTTQIPAPTSPPPPPLFYQFTSRTRREARNTPLTHAPYSNIRVLRTASAGAASTVVKRQAANFFAAGDSGVHYTVSLELFALTPLAVGLLQLPCPPSSSLPFPSLPLPPLLSFPRKDPPAPNHNRNFRAFGYRRGWGSRLGCWMGVREEGEGDTEQGA